MKLLLQPNRWSCLPTSLAMVADVTVDEVIDKIGHDGSERIFPTLPEPVCRRSFCIEEVQYVTMAYGFVLVPYSPGIIYEPAAGSQKQIVFPKFLEVLNRRNGLLFGTPTGKTLGHVVAWSAQEGTIYDPNGSKYPANAGCFTIETFYGCFKC